MITSDLLTDAHRLAELRGLAILDTPPEPEYDDLAAIAAAACRSAVAAVNFVDDERHFTKAITGMPEARGGSVSNDVSFCAATISTDNGVLIVPDTGADAAWREHPLVTGGPQVGFYAGASIMARGERVGVVCAFGREPRAFTEQERDTLAAVARQVGGQLELRRRNADLRAQTLTDPLTGLANRTLLMDRLEMAIADRGRTGCDVGVLFCDVDDFKGVNDTLGHEAGDRLLCEIAEHLRGAVRDTDTVARFAGDEFALVCPRVTSMTHFLGLADRVAEAVEDNVTALGPHATRLSVGSVLVRDGEGPADVLRRADAEMYATKAAQRSGPSRSAH